MDITQDGYNDPLHLIQIDLFVAPIVEASGPRALMVGHLLRGLELADVLQRGVLILLQRPLDALNALAEAQWKRTAFGWPRLCEGPNSVKLWRWL
ncbi:hypothetical protein G3480_04025 [Thiorhodococcus mannitoliphagus]|uniref:Uncharacterized protein n=1 Tax=Thiorhodococcus mannitoliphagus TaxID=329406 RepID=A0A6P1DNH2_9GAMM|nr:hypothetical protein [Thiorhodococcus mannitoliphagus]NEX19489.1 hypothetical protein [Thiorhodococcus mannitoliphagus]